MVGPQQIGDVLQGGRPPLRRHDGAVESADRLKHCPAVGRDGLLCHLGKLRREKQGKLWCNAGRAAIRAAREPLDPL